MRRKYFVVASGLYIAFGVIIVVRSVAAHVVPIAILGLVFVALGVVRLRDFARRGEGSE